MALSKQKLIKTCIELWKNDKARGHSAWIFSMLGEVYMKTSQLPFEAVVLHPSRKSSQDSDRSTFQSQDLPPA